MTRIRPKAASWIRTPNMTPRLPRSSPAPAKLEGDATNSGQGSPIEQEHWASFGSAGPRWVAEQIPVAETEATLPLDREVETTHAAFAAALANVDVRPEAVSDSLAPGEGLQNNSCSHPQPCSRHPLQPQNIEFPRRDLQAIRRI